MVRGQRRAGPRWVQVVFVSIVRIALRVVAAVCVDDLQGTASFKTPFRSASESSALQSYDIFSAGHHFCVKGTPFALSVHFGRPRIFSQRVL